MDTTAVAIKDLSIVRGGAQVLKRVGFEIQPGTVVGLIGPSGSGKTTLIRSIVGLQKITDGDVEVLGLTAGSAPLRDRVGYMAQASSVYEDLTVRQNIAYFTRILGYPKSEVDRVIQQVDLVRQRDQVVEKLSGGQRARVSLAIALVGRPALLVLDEPTVGLDPVLRRDLWELFRALGEDGVTLIISSHVMDEAAHCDQLLLLRGGKLIANDTVKAILKETDTRDVEAAFLRLVEKGRSDV
jgi:ABC-2 type transport system ATP-binding protein